MDHGRFEELKDAYVLGALPEEERREFEEYLTAHSGRQTEIEELSAVAGLLALSPREQEPSPELRRSIMGLVEPEAEPRRASSRSWLAGIREHLSVRNLALCVAASSPGTCSCRVRCGICKARFKTYRHPRRRAGWSR